MPELTQSIRKALDEIKDPCSLAAGMPLGLSEMGLVKDVAVGPGGAVQIELRLTSPFCHMIGFFKTEAIRLVGNLPGVSSVELSADNGLDWSPNDIAPKARARRAARVREMESLRPA